MVYVIIIFVMYVILKFFVGSFTVENACVGMKLYGS